MSIFSNEFELIVWRFKILKKQNNIDSRQPSTFNGPPFIFRGPAEEVRFIYFISFFMKSNQIEPTKS